MDFHIPTNNNQLTNSYETKMDPFERADITSNTYWDWIINHVGSVYGAKYEVFKFAASFKEYPPRSFPPSFNPAIVLDQMLREIKVEKKLREAFPLPAGADGKPKN
jgi:arylsulfatase